MKFKIQAGGEIDLLTKQEVGEMVDKQTADFNKMLSEGVMFGKLSSSLNTAVMGEKTPYYSSGTFELGGPEPGYVWSVNNITYFNLGTTGVDLLINGNQQSDAVYRGLLGNGTSIVGSNGFVVHGGQKIIVGATNALGGGATIVLRYLQVPQKDIGKL